ncbi:MAG TPA: IPT/TIG domain-containing protein [Solirubrobacteraceae bacterium]|nr:IPT/TIG domain-containing protein [Solirubrobacteraceae bacterium]
MAAALLSPLLGAALLDGSASAAVAAPTVAIVTPNLGRGTGGNHVTIKGTNFTGASAVEFGATPATSFRVLRATAITAIAPPGSGAVDVTVTTPEGGTSSTSSLDQFHYLPVVTGVSPIGGSVAGGTTVTIKGVDFTGATAVRFGSTEASGFAVNSSESITAISPPAAALGPVRVTVTTPQGTSRLTSTDSFKYRPTITSVSPNQGPASGGTEVTIKGSGFELGPTTITFGPARAADVFCPTTTECTVISPAAPPAVREKAEYAGTAPVDVKAKVGIVASATTAADVFTYTSPPPGVYLKTRFGGRLQGGRVTLEDAIFGRSLETCFTDGEGVIEANSGEPVIAAEGAAIEVGCEPNEFSGALPADFTLRIDRNGHGTVDGGTARTYDGCVYEGGELSGEGFQVSGEFTLVRNEEQQRLQKELEPVLGEIERLEETAEKTPEELEALATLRVHKGELEHEIAEWEESCPKTNRISLSIGAVSENDEEVYVGR